MDQGFEATADRLRSSPIPAPDAQSPKALRAIAARRTLRRRIALASSAAFFAGGVSAVAIYVVHPTNAGNERATVASASDIPTVRTYSIAELEAAISRLTTSPASHAWNLVAVTYAGDRTHLNVESSQPVGNPASEQEMTEIAKIPLKFTYNAEFGIKRPAKIK